MNSGWLFIFNSILLGLGLSADAFSVSVVDGCCSPDIRPGKSLLISGSFAFFQALMPMLGWLMTKGLISYFGLLQHIVPFISQILLIYLGVKIMRSKPTSGEERCPAELGPGTLLIQALATSVDALLAGLALSEYSFSAALPAALIIAAVTLAVCFAGIYLGKALGTKLLGKSSLLGGIFLIIIALESFIKTIF